MRKTKNGWVWICVVSIFMILLAYYPHLQKEMIQGSDDWFHLHRIYALAQGLKQGIFPVKIHHLAGYGYGYGVGFFYSNFFLYIPAVLINLFGISLANAYRIFALLIYIAIYFSMFYCVYRLTGKKELAFWAASVYLFSNKVMEAFYCNLALGQMCAFIFFPTAIIGMWLFLEKNENPILLMLGFIGLIYSHTISTFMAFVVCALLAVMDFSKIIKDLKKILRLVVSIGCVSMVTASFWLPMFEQMKSQLFKVKAPWTMSVENVMNISSLLKNREGLGYVVSILLCFNVIGGLKAYKNKQDGKYKFTLIAIMMILVTMWRPFWEFFNIDLNIKFLQFPNRLYAPVTVLIIAETAMIFADLTRKTDKIKCVPVIILLLSIVLSYDGYSVMYFNHVGNEKINQVLRNEVAAFGAGEEWLPMATDRDELIDTFATIDNEGNEVIGEKIKGYSRYLFEADLGKEYYDVPYIWYKGYTAIDGNGNKLDISQNEDTGLVRVYMPQNVEGSTVVEVFYGGTKYQKLAYLASGIGCMVLIAYVIYLKKIEQDRINVYSHNNIIDKVN